MNKKPLKPRGKQHDARAASFKRIAKALRNESRELRATGYDISAIDVRIIANVLDAEAKLLRSMR